MRNDLWRLFSWLGVAFGFPWLFLVLLPYVKQSSAAPVPYAESDEAGFVAYPDPNMVRAGASDYGAEIYRREGCAYCHTQMVRPTYAGPDMWRPGWGGREEEGLARETRPEDYIGEGYAQLGYQRIGPDLANVGTRLTDREKLHIQLYNPRANTHESIMPGFRHLYRLVPADGRDAALKLEGKFAPEEGFVVVPTPEAEALVDYLLSRRKDAKLPASIRPAVAEAAPAEAPAQ
ncbi:MAG: cbb3-type cytochrome c oxidase subunit II [Verrucomicrobiales bacterium]|nr:cbb3-type cytochrome c oxidase subunit II [Verrucomicrobiales bacterium]